VSGPLWSPSPERAAATGLARFAQAVGVDRAGGIAALHRLSVRDPEAFWTAVWERCGVVGERRGPALVDAERMPGARFFPEAQLNVADNLLSGRDADAPALVCRSEGGPPRDMTHGELRDAVARLAAALREWGIEPGDRVAAILPNGPEAIVGMLAASSVGAVWSSCSPDFGPRGVLDRFGQIAPRVLLACDGHRYAGRAHPAQDKLAAIVGGLPSVERVVVVPWLEPAPSLAALPARPPARLWPDVLAEAADAPLRFPRFPFHHPLAVLYSSGTTGAPKCIVHGAGGTLLQHAKEHRLHVDLGPDDRLFYFTTCGWMMWNWLASGLAAGATLVLYDGSPFHPEPAALFDLAESSRVTVFGTSAKFLDASAKAGLAPARSHDLSPLRTVLSTGSPLLPEGFDWVYQRLKRDVQLASMSGGTDLISCFVLGDPTAPVWRGEIQTRGLGMAVEVWNEAGERVVGEPGELVCTRPFPSMPLGFWGDTDGRRYRAAYFERFPGVWRQGDWTLETERGGFVIFGRSDAVLNPGGVRIGTAEIYAPVEALDEVEEAIAVGQEWEGDVRIVLFVRLREGLELDDGLRERIRAAVRRDASPRHVPARVLQVPDMPRTRSGKIVELAVREVVHGRPVKNVDALANPEALEHFRERPELRG
jgi:acetoacetyl-CoA synthetase